MKPLIFYFNFHDEESETEKMFGFIVNEPIHLYRFLGAETFDEQDSLYELITETIESKYGVHDWSSSPNPQVDAIGYTTYEVEKQNISQVMQEWKNQIEKTGSSCSKIVQITNNASLGDDLSIYNQILTIANSNKISHKKNA